MNNPFMSNSDKIGRTADREDRQPHDVLAWLQAKLSDTKLISSVVQPLSLQSL